MRVGTVALALVNAMLVGACATNQQALGADLSEAVPFYACAALNAARTIGSKPSQDGKPTPINLNAPAPDQIQIQLQVTTTTTHQAQAGATVGPPAGTPIAIQGQYQYQRQFADQHQVTIQYSDAGSIAKLEKVCNIGVPPPKPLQVTVDSNGVSAQLLETKHVELPEAPKFCWDEAGFAGCMNACSAHCAECGDNAGCKGAWCGGEAKVGCDNACNGKKHLAEQSACFH